MSYFWNEWWENTTPRLRDEVQDVIMCVSGKENRTDSGICNSLGWQSHFVREEFEPMGTFETRIGGCGREEFSERVVGQVG